MTGASLCTNGIKISHLLFADDSLLFVKAMETEFFQVLEILDSYARALGQEVNFDKSSILFSSNVNPRQASSLKSLLGITNNLENSNYPGLPIAVGRKRSATFAFIKDRFRRKLLSWKGKFLSDAGRETLIKYVFQSVPTYMMSIFKLPMTLSLDLKPICAKFFWGATEESWKINWKCWNYMCKTKGEGGLGFRKVEAFNLVLIAKEGWKIMTTPNALMCRMLKKKYFSRTSFMRAVKKPAASFLWAGFLEARSVLTDGGRWRVGDGYGISVFADKWIENCSLVPNLPLPCSCKIPEKVYKLIDSTRREWKVDVINTIFHSEAAARIKATPLSTRAADDGFFFKWDNVWQMKLPPKIKLFAWRMCNQALATKEGLLARRMEILPLCDVFGYQAESLLHLFRDCKWIIDIWSYYNLNFPDGDLTDFSAWLSLIFVSFNDEELSLFITIAWWVWKNRNSCVFDGSCARPLSFSLKIEAWLKLQNDLGATAELQNGVAPPATLFPIRWMAPQASRFKIIYDAAYDRRTLKCFYGCVVRDCLGRVSEAFCGFIGLAESAPHAESMAAIWSNT